MFAEPWVLSQEIYSSARQSIKPTAAPRPSPSYWERRSPGPSSRNSLGRPAPVAARAPRLALRFLRPSPRLVFNVRLLLLRSVKPRGHISALTLLALVVTLC